MKKGAIFVSLASYRDHLCANTVAELFSKCVECDKVFVGLVEQSRPSDPRCTAPNQYRNQVRLVHVPAEQSEGPTFARYVASKLYENEVHSNAHTHTHIHTS